MTLRFPDISAYQAGIALAGAPAVCVKATEGAGWANRDYKPALDRAAAAGAFATAYHFLHAGNPAAQAAWCHSHTGTTPLMVDVEPTTGSRPALADAAAFTDAYRAAGGIIHLAYLPRWYWAQLGSPSLAALASRGLALWSSNYTAYSDSPAGAGWAPYGGMTPVIWQYTSAQPFNGQPVDFNAWRGDLAGFRALAAGGTPPPRPPAAPPFPYPAGHYLGQPSPSPYCHSGYYGGPDTVHVHDWQARMAARGWIITCDGRFGPQAENVARKFQQQVAAAVDGRVGRDTWTASFTAPVTR